MTFRWIAEEAECSTITPVRVDHAKIAVRIYVNTAVTNEVGTFVVKPIIVALHRSIVDMSADYIYSCYARASAFTNFMKDKRAVVRMAHAEDSMFIQSIFKTVSLLAIETSDTVHGVLHVFDADEFVLLLNQLTTDLEATHSNTYLN